MLIWIYTQAPIAFGSFQKSWPISLAKTMSVDELLDLCTDHKVAGIPDLILYINLMRLREVLGDDEEAIRQMLFAI